MPEPTPTLPPKPAASATPTPEPSPSDSTSAYVNPYADAKTSDWFYEAVAFASQNGLFVGIDERTFAPQAQMTRAMLVTVLHRLAGEPAPTGRNVFADVRSGEWYVSAVTWANENGIVNGVGDLRFAPDDAITREQAVAILYRYAVFMGATSGATSLDSAAYSGSLNFIDSAEISDWATDAVKWSASERIIAGKPGNLFDPQGGATRAEIASILMRFALKIY
jgi:hypothetical protein